MTDIDIRVRVAGEAWTPKTFETLDQALEYVGALEAQHGERAVEVNWVR